MSTEAVRPKNLPDSPAPSQVACEDEEHPRGRSCDAASCQTSQEITTSTSRDTGSAQ